MNGSNGHHGGPAPLIQAQSVHKRFGRKAVLRGVDLTVNQGEVVALLGANGAGKTTLIRLICGLDKPDRGQIALGGVQQKQAGHELRRYVGVVSHAPLLYDDLSSLENLRFFAQLYDIVDPDVRIQAVLRAVDLWHRRYDPVRTYSRGLTQRLAIGRAILHDPPVLLLDEPDTGLDQASAEMLRGLIRQLGGSNRAVLLTTHNLDRAIEWSDKICLLVDGRIVYEAATNELAADDLKRIYRQLAIEQNGLAGDLSETFELSPSLDQSESI
jgi:heme exporter protein A